LTQFLRDAAAILRAINNVSDVMPVARLKSSRVGQPASCGPRKSRVTCDTHHASASSQSSQECIIVLKLHTAMRIRGTAKVICVAIVANQLLTTVFSYAVHQVDPNAPSMITTIFSFITCGLVSLWLQSDARRAYLLARDKGCITPVNKTNPALKIAPDCPRLWLVVLHIEMNPAAVGL
jgi:hypothetical protein